MFTSHIQHILHHITSHRATSHPMFTPHLVAVVGC